MDEIAVLDIESATVLQTRRNLMFVIPAQAGTQCTARTLDSRLRGNDDRIAALDLESAEVLQAIRGLL
jgi:hypothetical protein